MINQNRQQKLKHKKNGKKLIKKVTAFLLAFTILVTGLPMREISELTSCISFASLISCVSQLDFINSIQSVLPDFKDWDGFHGILFSEPELSASAEEAVENTLREATTINITTKEELIAYANGTLKNSNGDFLGYHSNDTLSIAFSKDNLEITDTDSFPGIGTSIAPFTGKIKILNVLTTDPYGEFKKLSLNNVSLFNYISTDAQFINSSDESTPLLLNVGDSGTAPLFAKNVTRGDNPKEWNIVVNADNCQTGGLIGCNNGNAKLNVSYLSSGAVNTDSDAGAICGKMEKESSLELALKDKCLNISRQEVDCVELGDVTGNSNAGGLIGLMESGAMLTINELPTFATVREISASNGYAGGLVGKCDGGTITFSKGVNYNDTASNTITGTSGAGGVFGYYGVLAENSVEINSNVYEITGSNTITASGQSAGAGGLIGVLQNNGTNVAPSLITISGGNISSTLNSNNSGGLIGTYKSSCLENTLTISSVNTTSSRTNGNYGGLIGYMENAYVRTEDINNIIVSSEGGNSGGLVGQIKNSFLDVAGENTISGNKIQAGVLHTMEGDSVIRLSGKTDVKDANITQANLIQNRKDSLVYALGSGTDYNADTKTGWSYYRPDNKTSTLEDVNAWGQVVRLVNNQTLEEAGVVTVDSEAHTVTLNGIVPNGHTIFIANSADFAKVALNVKLNDKEKTAGVLRTSSIYINSTVLDNTNITLELTGNVDLKGTGITGFTKDYESDKNRQSQSFLGTLNGNDYSITIANGEAYGFRGTVNLTEADLSDSSKWGNTGAVVGSNSNYHKHSSLFSRIGSMSNRAITATVKNLKIDGNVRIFANIELKIGGIASQMIGNTKLENVSVTANFDYYGQSATYSGVGRFFGMDNDWDIMNNKPEQLITKNLTIKDCTSDGIIKVSGKINTNKFGLGTFGTISRIENATDINVDGLTLKGKIQTDASTKDGEDYYTFGGLIGVVLSYDNKIIPDQTFELNNLTVDNFEINSTSNYEHCGGLLGGIWRGVNVIVNNVEVTNGSKITLGANKSQTVGGLVTQATGYWRVENLKYTDFTIGSTETPNTIGLIVGEGWEPTSTQYSIDTNRLYLEITDYETSFTMNNVTLPKSCTTFDELVGKTIKGVDLGSNGQGFVSIHTSNDKLNMTTDSGNEYTPKTELGQIKVNPYTRYYYNLDYLLKNANTGGEKFLLWSVYNYAAPNIQSNTNLTNKIKGNNKNSFDDYSELPTESDINLENLSYYPIDISSPVSLTGKTIKLNNSEMQAAHGTQYSTRAYSQHYLMHCGLFRNVSGSFSLKDCTLSGTASAYQNNLKSATSEQNYQGSGALVCGKIEGISDSKANLNVNGLTLSNLTIANFNENGIGTTGIGLLVNNIGSYSNTSISTVTTNDYADNTKAAHALINQAGSKDVMQMSISFSDMRLDSRKDSSQGDDSFNTAYNTKQSIFTKGTLINTLQYNAYTSGSSAIYNYNYNDDWDGNNALHNVTYGKEISDSSEYNHKDSNTDLNDHQTRYLDMHAKDDTNHYTSWENNSATAVGDFSEFLPYVGTPYNADNNYHEIAVNHISIEIKEGCGTYNDPYIIDDGATLSTVAKVINSGTFGKGFSLYIDNDYLTGFDVNFEKWDNSKSAGTGHTRFEYDGSKFVRMKKENNEWIEDNLYTGNKPSFEQVRAYLAGAYYQITGTAENKNTITLSNSYLGLGAENSDYAFRGVIVGKSYVEGNNVTVVNQSEAPFIKVSNGCVVKDININITANTITLTNSNISTAAKFDYNSGCKYYGGVIGEIMGGDSVIDDVNVTFGETAEKTTAIKIVSGNSSNPYQYTQIVPVGGYVGVVVYGGLIFRNMGTQSISTIGNLTVTSYKYDGSTEISSNAMNDTNMAHLYVNPIVGRVVNAYVINETSSYNYTNATATLKNSTKNYAIPDLNKDTANIITFSREDSTDKVDTINVPDGQSLFVLSLITQSMCGNATSATEAYKTTYSYGEGTKTTHLAKYNAVGTNDSSQPDDFSKDAIKDTIGASNTVPYLIAHYTEKTNDNNYPARAITGKNTNYHYMKLTGDSDYNLPECFRGIGLVYSLNSYDNVRHNLMNLYGLNGNGKTIYLNTKFYNKSCLFDPYYKNPSSTSTDASEIGLGLFTDLYADIPTRTKVSTETSRAAHSDDVIKEPKNALYNFKLSGTIEHFQYDNKEKVTNNSNNQRACTGGLIGNLSYSGNTAERVYNIWNVSLNNLKITCDGRVGGFFGKLPQKTLYIYINDCDANNLNIETSFNDAGAIVGSLDGNNNIRLFVNTLSDKVNNYKISIKSATYFSCGGLIGWMKAQYVTLMNINIIGSGDKRIGIIDESSIQQNNNNSVKDYRAGGAIGYIEGGNVLLDNVNVYGVNIYGGHSGGLIGSMNSPTLRIYNCGVHGKSDDKVPIDDNETYYIEGYRQAGGIVGYQNNNNTDIKYDSITYSNDIDGCYVNNYTIKQYQNSGDVGAGGIIACNSNNINRKIANSMVSDCTIACNGQGENRGMGGIIGWTKGDNGIGVQCYNIAVKNLTFDTTKASNTTTNAVKSYYGLFCGCANNSPAIKLVGYTAQGTNKVNVAFYDKLTTCPRNVEFDLGRKWDNPDPVIPSIYHSSSYIIYADYDGSCLNPDTRKTEFSDQTLATNVSKAVSNDDNFPYVTSSPFHKFGTNGKFLTGDGVSKSAQSNIISSLNDHLDAKQYKNITETDKTVYNQLIDEKKLVTDDETLPDIPVIIMDSATYDYDTAIKAYLRILTNNKYKFDGSDETGIYNIDILSCNTNGAEPTISKTLHYTGGKFSMDKSEFDSNTVGQFSLIDVQFFAPNDTTKVAYHLYVPVITKKLYYYGFKTTVFSGTHYYESKYTSETGDIGFNGNNPKVLMENYGTPVTQYLRWTYPTNTLVSDVLAGGFGLDWNYKKDIKITMSYGDKIPAGSKLVLIDKNNQNKEYYYTVSGNETYNGQTLILDFDSFKDINEEKPNIVNFQSLVTEQLNFQKSDINTEERGTFVEDSENGTFTVKIDGQDTKLRLANDNDTDTFNLSVEQTEMYEDYYLTIYSEEDKGTLYHQLQITSANPLTPNKPGKISSSGKELHSVQINLANLFSNTISVTTVDSDTSTNIEMNDIKNDVNVHVTSVIKFNYTDVDELNNLKALLTTNSIPIYHSKHVYMNKRSTNNGAAEKIIGDIESIKMISDSYNTITAYSTYDKYESTENVKISEPSPKSYSDVNGEAVTNFFEVREMNEGNEINIADYLTSGDPGVAPTVVVDSCFKIKYSHAGIIVQFPERDKSEESSNIGTSVSARSSLAYSPSDTTYSSSMSDIAEDSAKRLYYRYQMTDADLKFNVYHTDIDKSEEVSGDIITKANDQLGINIFDSGTDKKSVIQTKGIFDASQLSALEKNNLNVRWTIELRCKQDNYSDDKDLKLLDYLNGITVKDVDENTLATLTNSSSEGIMQNEGKKWYYQAERSKFEEIDNPGLFDIYLDFDVKTGADLQAVANAFYSNYKIVLTATLCEGSSPIDGTSDDDYLIYTNARLDPTFVNMP